MSTFDPYADDAASLGIGELTLENGQNCVAVYGSLDLSRDMVGLKHARELKAVLEAVVCHLEAARDLPNAVPPPAKPTSVKNPFS